MNATGVEILEAPSDSVSRLGTCALSCVRIRLENVLVIAFLGVPNIVLTAIIVAVVAVIFRSRVFGANEPTDTSWVDAWMKAIFILVAITTFSVYLPSYVMQTSTVAGFDRDVQQLVGTAVWSVAFGSALFLLWYAHREKRV